MAQLADVRDVARLLVTSFHRWERGWRWLYPLLQLSVYEDLRQRLRSPDLYYACFVAHATTPGETAETLVGTIEIGLQHHPCWWLPCHHLYIANLAVIAPHRRQGIARQLLTHCEDTARRWGFREIYLHVLANNEGAYRLYSQQGYDVKRQEHNLWEWLWRRSPRLLLFKRLS